MNESEEKWEILPGDADAEPPSLADLGASLAQEARKRALIGSDSTLQRIDELEHPQATTDSEMCLELFLFHLFGFLTATIDHGEDGAAVRREMIRAAPEEAEEILADSDGPAADEADLLETITDRVKDYEQVLPAALGGKGPEGESDFVRFGSLAASRVFGLDAETPTRTAAATLFIILFQSARTNASILLGNHLAAGDG